MGFFDFFKGKKEKIIEKVKFEELEGILDKKDNQNKEKKQELTREIKQRLNELIETLHEKTPILEKVDLDAKREDVRAKFIIRENLEKYLFHLKKFIENLENLIKNSNDLIQEINSVFSDFEKKSSASFQKATYLIGKELGDVRDLIVNFFINFKKLISQDSNNELLLNCKTINTIQEILKELTNLEKTELDLKKSIDQNKQDKKRLENNVKNLENKIEEIKQNLDYKQEIDKINEINEKKEKIKKQIYQLKDMIDFKFLTNIFHSNKKDMIILKEHNLDFQKSFEKNKGEEIINLIRETNLIDSEMDKELILKKTEEILENQKQIKDLNIEIPNQEKIDELELEIKKLKSEIQDLITEKSREEKKLEKLELTKNELIDSIKPELVKIDLELIKNSSI